MCGRTAGWVAKSTRNLTRKLASLITGRLFLMLMLPTNDVRDAFEASNMTDVGNAGERRNGKNPTANGISCGNATSSPTR